MTTPDPAMTTPDPAGHKLPGEHVYDEMTLSSSHVISVLDRIRNTDFSEDLLVAAYPKTGSTWLEELVWIIQNSGDVTTARGRPLFQRVPFLEMWAKGFDSPVLDLIDTLPSPRVLKTHLPARYFRRVSPDSMCKVIVQIRNPKDVLVSYYHFYRMNTELNLYTGTWDQFFHMFKRRTLLYGHYFDWYDDWLPMLETGRVMLTKYEDMVRDLAGEVKGIASFLGQTLADDQVQDIVKHCSFTQMAGNDMVNYRLFPDQLKQGISPFMRRGVVGDWQNYFSDEQSKYVDDLYASWLEKGGVTLDFI